MCNCRKKAAEAPAPAPVAPRSVPTPRRQVAAARSPPPLPQQQREVLSTRRVGFRHRTVTTTRLAPLVTLDTSLWGPPLWRVLHTISTQATDVAPVAAALRALDGALPCPDCAGHYHMWLASHPLPTTVAAAQEWILELHNAVNARSDPPKEPWTIDAVAATYTDIGAARTALDSLRSQIGVDGWRALAAATATLALAATQ